MKIKDLMTTDVLSVQPDKGFNFVEIFAELKHVRHVPVVDEEKRLLGIVSVRDMLAHLSNAAASHFTPIGEVMNKEVYTISPTAEVAEAAELMLQKKVGCLPVIEDDRLVGIVSERDFLKLATQ